MTSICFLILQFFTLEYFLYQWYFQIKRDLYLDWMNIDYFIKKEEHLTI